MTEEDLSSLVITIWMLSSNHFGLGAKCDGIVRSTRASKSASPIIIGIAISLRAHILKNN